MESFQCSCSINNYKVSAKCMRSTVTCGSLTICIQKQCKSYGDVMLHVNHSLYNVPGKYALTLFHTMMSQSSNVIFTSMHWPNNNVIRTQCICLTANANCHCDFDHAITNVYRQSDVTNFNAAPSMTSDLAKRKRERE